MKKSLVALISFTLSISAVSPVQASQSTVQMDQCKLIGNNTSDSSFRYEDSGHIENWSQFVKPVGPMRMLVIPMDFSDVPARTPVAKELGFLKEVEQFFTTSSQGKMQLVTDSSMDWVRMPKTAAHYKKAFWADKINEAIDLVDPNVDFSKYDVVLFYISKNNKVTTEAGALPGFPDRKPDGLSQIRGVYLGNDYWRQQGHHAGVTVHEMLHVFGLPDLYSRNKDGTKNVGVFDIMDAYVPSLGMRLFYWNRWKLGWLDDSQVLCLDPQQKQEITITKANKDNTIWVFPLGSNRVAVFQSWTLRSKLESIAYVVDTKDFVWNSASRNGSGESPIQMLRPKRAGKAPVAWEHRNLEVVLKNKDVIQSSIGKFSVASSTNGIKITFSPKK